jgi:hypothetical protein
MKTFIREKYNFEPIGFTLVSNKDHLTLVPGMFAPYFVSINGDEFHSGTGWVRDTGAGSYSIIVDTNEKDPKKKDYGPRLVFIPGSELYDPVYFRLVDLPAIEVAPISQNIEALFPFAMISEQDHVSLFTGAVPTIDISRDGGPFQTHFGLPFEIGNGFYGVYVTADTDPTMTDFNNECIYTLKATASGADVTYDSFQVFRYLRPS